MNIYKRTKPTATLLSPFHQSSGVQGYLVCQGKEFGIEAAKNYTQVTQSQSCQAILFIFLHRLKYGNMGLQVQCCINKQENDLETAKFWGSETLPQGQQ